MEKIIKLALFGVLTMISQVLSAQNIVQPGLISGRLTISPSISLTQNQNHFYLHGNAEVYLENNISLSGEGYYYLGNISSEGSTFDFNHNLFFGASYHFLKNDNDLFIGLQPGISFTKLNPAFNNLSTSEMGVNPVASVVFGYNLYIHDFFHFFIHPRLVLGEHTYDKNKSLAELRFSAGLGFNIHGFGK